MGDLLPDYYISVCKSGITRVYPYHKLHIIDSERINGRLCFMRWILICGLILLIAFLLIAMYCALVVASREDEITERAMSRKGDEKEE